MTWAVLDWGIGGCGLYKLLKARLPEAPVLYWSDAGFTPYGKVEASMLAARLDAVLTELHARGATRVVVACNAASTVLDWVAAPERLGLAVTGVIEPTLAAVERRLKRKTIGVIGGRRTILSHVYARRLRRAGFTVHQRIAQPLSAFVEAGEVDTPEVRAEIAKILGPLSNIDALVMACTHYPALAPHFRRLLPDAELIDPAAATFSWIERHWGFDEANTTATDQILTTGPIDVMQRSAMAAFGLALAPKLVA